MIMENIMADSSLCIVSNGINIGFAFLFLLFCRDYRREAEWQLSATLLPKNDQQSVGRLITQYIDWKDFITNNRIFKMREEELEIAIKVSRIALQSIHSLIFMR